MNWALCVRTWADCVLQDTGASPPRVCVTWLGEHVPRDPRHTDARARQGLPMPEAAGESSDLPARWQAIEPQRCKAETTNFFEAAAKNRLVFFVLLFFPLLFFLLFFVSLFLFLFFSGFLGCNLECVFFCVCSHGAFF